MLWIIGQFYYIKSYRRSSLRYRSLEFLMKIQPRSHIVVAHMLEHKVNSAANCYVAYLYYTKS